MKINNVWKVIVIILLPFLIVNFVPAQSGRGEGRLNGKVLDENGNPLENAKIVITNLMHRELSFETTSNKKGRWAFVGLGTGMWRVLVTAEGYSPAYKNTDVKQLQKNPEISIALKKIGQTAYPASQDESSLNLFDQGNKFFAKKKYDEAVSAFEQFLEKNPEAYQVYINVGNCYIQKNELDKATQEFNKVLERIRLEKEDLGGNEIAAKAMAGIGEVYFLKEDYENAKKYFKNVLDIYPTDEYLAYNLGELYFSNSEIDDAIHYFELSKQINPEWGKPYLKLGYAYLNKGDLEKAKENLRKFIEIDPDSPEIQTAQNILKYLEKQKK